MAILARIALIVSLMLLAACDSAEERAAKHFERAVELLEDGDLDRAIVEFRNVLALDGSNSEARRFYARAARSSGNIPDAYANYLALSELQPDDPEARLALAEMAILAQSWDDAKGHVDRLRAVDSKIDGFEIVDLADRFRDAVVEENLATVGDLLRSAEALDKTSPGNPILERVLIEGYLVRGEVQAAIAVTESAIERGEDNPLYYIILADLLASEGETDKLEAHLRQMLEVFPDDIDAKQRLIALYVREGRADSAEAFLRAEIETAEDKVAAHVSLIALIRTLKGQDAALAELESALELYEQSSLLLALKAGILFDRGDRVEAIELLQSVVDAAEPGDETDRYKVTLAKMLATNGNDVGARTLVEQVLDRDPGQVEALKMRATWQIQEDQNDAAIATLRQALDQEPEDAEAMTLMARAHERNGDRELAQDLLSLAVEASNNAPAESLRMAGALVRQERFRTAEEILVSALRRTPGNEELLVALGQIYVATEDWPRAEQVMSTLRRLDTERARLAADELQLRAISSRQGREQGIAYLEELVANSEGAGGNLARLGLIQAKLAANEGEEALSLAEQLVNELPNESRAELVLGNTQFALGDLEAAEATFRGVLEKEPGNGLAAIQMVRLMSAQGRIDDARELIDTGLEANPSQQDLLWAKASFLERENDIEGAIDIYERLYALNSDSAIVANNLASLLVTYREDEESLERAYRVGRRLRGTAVAPFQDTYGWLLYRRGQFEESLTYLEPAAQALDRDPIVRYHLGKAYAAVGRDDEALQAFEGALELAAASDPRSQLQDARAEIERLENKGKE